MIQFHTNEAEFEKQLASAFDVLESKMSLKYFAFTQQVFKSLVVTSPQWSGNLASNWNYSVNVPDNTYFEIYEKQESPTYKVGADPAVGKALARAASVAVPTWRQPVFITNATPSDEAGYLVQGIADGQVKLRPVNLMPAQGMIISFTVNKFEGVSL